MTRSHRAKRKDTKQRARPATGATQEELSRFESEGGPPEQELEVQKPLERSPPRKIDRARR